MSSTPPDVVGEVRSGVPRVQIELIDPGETMTAVVDTGFSGALVVPEGTFARWQRVHEADVIDTAFATGEVRACLALNVTVRWLGSERVVQAVELGAEALIGHELLTGTTIHLDGAVVRIQLMI
jgi:clan AA aspartic protease